jgi:GxxExxY protein
LLFHAKAQRGEVFYAKKAGWVCGGNGAIFLLNVAAGRQEQLVRWDVLDKTLSTLCREKGENTQMACSWWKWQKIDGICCIKNVATDKRKWIGRFCGECLLENSQIARPRLIWKVYEEVFCYECVKADIKFERQKRIDLSYEGVNLGLAYKPDIMLEEKLIVEIKSIEQLDPIHYKQLLSYLKLTNCKLGLLINFNQPLLKKGIHRVVNGL